MRILIAGANGGVGQELLKEVVSHGQSIEVFALVRTPAKLPPDLASACAGVLGCDAADAAAVRDALAEARPDFLVVAIGAGLSDDKTRTDTTRVLVDELLASPDERVRAAKVVAVSSLGASGSMNQVPWVMRPFLGFMLRNVLKDHTAQEIIIKEKMAAGKWMLVRPTNLQDGPGNHNYEVSTHGGALRSTKVRRADVAHFIMEQITGEEDDRYWGKAVTIVG
jgi:nucleoside-diphosphate-sugar epimerase